MVKYVVGTGLAPSVLMTPNRNCRGGACSVLVSETAHYNLCHKILRAGHDRFTTEQDTHIIEL